MGPAQQRHPQQQAHRSATPPAACCSQLVGACLPPLQFRAHAPLPPCPPTTRLQVYEHLVPLVVAAADPLPLSQFTQKCCDVLLPVLEKERELGAHAFKSQFGRLNEFVCPELARRAGLADSGFNREAKTVRALRCPPARLPALPA